MLAAIAIVGSGAVVATQLGVFGSAETEAIDTVPADVDVLVRIDGDVVDDPMTERLLNGSGEQVPAPAGPGNVSEGVEAVENETPFEPEAIDEMVAFGRTDRAMETGTADYFGVVVHTDRSPDEFLSAVRNESGADYEETTIDGKTVYRPAGESPSEDDSWVAVLGDGEYVVGSERAVKDSIAVDTGEMDSVGGTLQETYEATRDGLLAFAVRVPQERIPNRTAGSSPVDVTQYNKVEVVAGTYYTTESSVGLELRLLTRGTDAAKDVADVTDGAVSFASGTVRNESVKETLRAIEVERDEGTVVVSYEAGVDSLLEVVNYYLGLGTRV